MNLNESFKLVGEWTITRVDANTGTILDTETVHNIIVNTGKERVAKLNELTRIERLIKNE